MSTIATVSRTQVAARIMQVLVWSLAGLLVVTAIRLAYRSGPSDFMQFYFAGKLVARGQTAQLYNESAYEPLVEEVRAQGETTLFTNAYRFNRPAFSAFFYVPLSFFSYRATVAVGMALNVALLGVLVWKIPVWFPFAAFFGVDLFRLSLLLFMPFVIAIGQGQDTMLLTLLVAHSLRLARVGREIPAGLLLAAALFKPHVIWAIPLALWAAGKRRMVGVFLAAGILLAAVSVAAVGLDGIGQWIRLLDAPSTDYKPEVMANVRALGLQFGPAAGLVAAVFACVCFAVVLWRGSLSDRFSAAVLCSPLLSPHTYGHDFSLIPIVAALSPYQAARYALVLPWVYFYPLPDLLPWAYLSLAYLGLLAIPTAAKDLNRPCERRPS